MTNIIEKINPVSLTSMKKFAKQDIEDILSLTPMQEGMIFHYLQNPQSDLYFEQLSLNISGEINIPFFEQTWNWVIKSNEMLRTLFHWENVENPVQIVLKKFILKPGYFNLSDRETSEKKKVLKEIKTNDRKDKFDLREVPFRVTLCKLDEYQYEVIISNHHILYDGWSNGIILKEFFKIYSRLAKGKPSLKPLVKTKFKEFVRWMQSQDTRKQEEFWKEYLEGFKARWEYQCPAKRYKRKDITHTGNHCLKLPGEMKDKLEGFVKNRNITIASLLYSVWGVLLQQYNFTNDVIFDTTVSGRSAKVKEIENMVGLFINTLPLRVQTNPGEKMSDLLSRMYHMLQRRGIFENSSPLSINEFLHEGHKEQLFDSVVVLENYPLDRILMQENGPLTVNSFWISGMTHYDLTVIVTIFYDIKVNVTYNKYLFDEDSMLRLSDRFTAIFREVLDNPGKTPDELDIFSEQERNKQMDKKRAVESKFQGSVCQEITYTDALPTDEMEEGLVRIWEEVLGKRPGPDDDFFEIGGNSLELVRIYKQIHARYPGKIKVNDFFGNPTIRKLKEFLISKDIRDVAASVKKEKIRNIDF